jgi:RNA polymerase sigma factor (sigma-70 family)
MIFKTDLVGKYSKSKEDEAKLSKEDLVEVNLPFAVKQANTFSKMTGLCPDELAMEAAIAMVHAADRFDPTYNVKFISFASKYIRDRMKQYSIKYGRGQTKQSRHYYFLNNKIKRFIADYVNQNNEKPTDEQIQNHFNIKELTLKKTRYANDVKHSSIDDPDIADWVQSQHYTNTKSPDSQLIMDDIKNQVISIFASNSIPERNIEIFNAIVYNEEKGIDVAARFGISPSSVTTIINRLRELLKENLDY